MPKVILKRDIKERVLYDNRLSWAAKGVMARLLNDELSLGETYFNDDDWNRFVRTLLGELEINDYIRFTDNGENELNIFIL